MSDAVMVHDGSGNVFADLGAPDPEERLARAELARVVRRVIRERGLTQTRAAEILGVRRPDVSDLMRGRFSRFGVERLERFLSALGVGVPEPE